MSDVNLLKAKLADWKHRLNMGDQHSIGRQIDDMLWRSTFYRSLNASRQFLLDDKEGGKQGNGPLHELIDYGYLIANSTAIRRLLDKSDISGPRGVYSLHGLLRDIKDNIKLTTRKNFLQARGLEYDFEPIKDRAFEKARLAAEAKGKRAYGISSDGWREAEYWHRIMDQLCGVAANNRSTSDMPDQSKFEWLLQGLEDNGRNVQDWVDKFVAHAASPDSRKTLQAGHQSLSLAKLWLAERVIVRTASFIARTFVNGNGIGGVPIPQFDQFAYLDQPFIQPTALEAMHRAWDRHCDEINSCKDWSWDRPLSDASDVRTDTDE